MPKRDDEMVPLKTEVVAALRNERGLTRPKMADRVDCSRSHYNNAESGRKWVKKALANLIARELGKSVDELIDHEKLRAKHAEQAGVAA